MRWVLGVVGVLIVVVLVIVAVGYMLPKAHVASVTAQYAAKPDTLWATLTDISAFPEWRKDVKRVELLPDANGQRSWREHGSNDVITYRIEAAEPSRRLVTRIADETLPFGGTWTYELVPAGNGTRLTITEHGEVYNPIFRFVSRFFLGYTGTMSDVLTALGTRHGESITPTAAPAG